MNLKIWLFPQVFLSVMGKVSMPSLAADIEETKDEAWSKQVDVVSQVSKMLL